MDGKIQMQLQKKILFQRKYLRTYVLYINVHSFGCLTQPLKSHYLYLKLLDSSFAQALERHILQLQQSGSEERSRSGSRENSIKRLLQPWRIPNSPQKQEHEHWQTENRTERGILVANCSKKSIVQMLSAPSRVKSQPRFPMCRFCVQMAAP